MRYFVSVMAYVDPGFMAAFMQFLFVVGLGVVTFFVVGPINHLKAFVSRLRTGKKVENDDSTSQACDSQHGASNGDH